MSQRPPKKNRSGKNTSRKNRSQPTANPQQRPQSAPQSARTVAAENTGTTPGEGTPERSSERRNARREAAVKKEQQKKQMRLIIGGAIAAVIVAVILIVVNLPSNDGADIDYDGLAAAPPPIAASAATPESSPEAAGATIPYTGATLGDPNAPVTFVIYADYQCHFCVQFHEDSYPKIIDDFVREGDVKIEFREFPALGEGALTDEGNESAQAAEAAMCAAEQDRYQDYHDKLYANFSGVNQGGFSNDRLRQFADDLGLDTDAFNACLDSGRYEPYVMQSMDEGRALGISATPMFIIDNGNGEPNVVQQTNSGYDLLQRQIQAAVDTAP